MIAIGPLPIEAEPWLTRDWSAGIDDYGNVTYVQHQRVYRFANGYGASVVQGTHTYGGPDGLYVLAVIVFDGEEWELTCDTPVTGDVLGHLSLADVAGVLVQIAALEPAP